MEILKANLRGVMAGNVLDVATGRGEFVQILLGCLSSFESITAVDNSDRAVEFARTHLCHDRVRVMKMDGANLEFENASFDIVCISNSLHHLAHPGGTLTEMLRVLRPGGLFIINEMCCDRQSETQMSHVGFHHWSARIDSMLGVFHRPTHTRNEIMDIADSLGLEEMKTLEYDAPADGAKDPEMLGEMFEAFDRVVDRIQDRREYASLKKEGDQIRERMMRVGLSGATQIIILGRKAE